MNNNDIGVLLFVIFVIVFTIFMIVFIFNPIMEIEREIAYEQVEENGIQMQR